MRYRTAAAFRQALEARLRNLAQQSDGRLSQVRLRKAVVFDRVLARLQRVAPDEWTLKGGLALDYRLGPSARMTRDMDLAFLEDADAATAALIAAQLVDLGDHFTFAIRRTDQLANLEGAAVRFHAQAALAGRLFDEVTIDISFSDPLGWPPERHAAPDLLEFADIAPLAVPILPLEQHIAEKVHAYTRGVTVQVSASLSEALGFGIRKGKGDWCDDRPGGASGQNRPDLPDFAYSVPSHILSQCGIWYLNGYREVTEMRGWFRAAESKT